MVDYHYTRDDLLKAIEAIGIRPGDTPWNQERRRRRFLYG
ncbi:hypothetical protein ACVWYQ_003373 [Bradyrhizobium sp. USDA 3397]